jgi:hypothetical protein
LVFLDAREELRVFHSSHIRRDCRSLTLEAAPARPVDEGCRSHLHQVQRDSAVPDVLEDLGRVAGPSRRIDCFFDPFQAVLLQMVQLTSVKEKDSLHFVCGAVEVLA